MQINWKKIQSEYELENPPDFITHLNYVSSLSALSRNLTATCNLSIKNKIQECKLLNKKINLINLTKKNIKGEYEIIRKNPEFAELCVSWISVKAYYLIFNSLLILEHLLTGTESSLKFTHKEAIRRFKEDINRKDISFNKKIFNKNFDCLDVMKVKIKPGSNIKIFGIGSTERISQILKKLVDYKLEDFRRTENVKDFRLKKNQQKKKDFLTNNSVNLWEFFYWYRIKANYRDLEFLDKDISSSKFCDFYNNYSELTWNFFGSLKNIINDLSKIRLGKSIL